MMEENLKKRTLAAALLALAMVSPAMAAPRPTVTDAWIRALPGKLPAGGYFTLHNATAKAVTLIGASSPACGMLMLHKSESVSGVASMGDVSTIDVPAGGTLKFAPGGYHLMCMDPAASLKKGGTVMISLEFSGGTTQTIEFSVRGANGR